MSRKFFSEKPRCFSIDTPTWSSFCLRCPTIAIPMRVGLGPRLNAYHPCHSVENRHFLTRRKKTTKNKPDVTACVWKTERWKGSLRVSCSRVTPLECGCVRCCQQAAGGGERKAFGGQQLLPPRQRVNCRAVGVPIGKTTEGCNPGQRRLRDCFRQGAETSLGQNEPKGTWDTAGTTQPASPPPCLGGGGQIGPRRDRSSPPSTPWSLNSQGWATDG